MLLSNWLLNFFPNSRANCLKASTTLSVSGPSSSKEQLRNEKARILLPYNKFDSTFEVSPVSWQLPSLFQGSVAIQKMFLTLNALQSRHNVKSLFESSGKAAGPYLSFLKHESTRDISSSPEWDASTCISQDYPSPSPALSLYSQGLSEGSLFSQIVLPDWFNGEIKVFQQRENFASLDSTNENSK